MPFHHVRRAAWLGAFIAAIAAAAFGASAYAAARSDTVTLSEFKLVPSPKSITHGKVTFTAKNKGDLVHELTVIKTSRAASKLPVSNGRASDKGSVGEVENIASGKSKKLTLNLAKGHYALICNIKGHYAAGMYSDFTAK